MQDNNISTDNKRIAKNTAYLYVRMFVTMIVALYTSRIVLRILGASDFGLYNVVGGVITMFSMFSGTLASGTQRFLTFAMGESNFAKLQTTFSLALGLHVVVSLILFVLAQTIGLWFLNTQMNIPEGRGIAAFWVYQFSIVAFIVSIIQIPFMSCIIAHERMGMYAYMSIYDVVMKLLVVIILQFLSYDKLILYAFMILIIDLTSMLIYNFYCRKNFNECTWKIRWDKQLAIKIISFSGWNIFGSSVGFANGQGINILLNIFCGTVVNAARGISVIICNFVSQFVNNFQTAVNPQLIKLFAAKEYEKMYRLTVNSCRINGYLFLMIAIPAGIEIKFLLKLWLGEYPQYTEAFVQIILLQALLNTLDRPLITHIHASGKVKMPNLTGGIVLLMVLPISYILLKLGYSPIVVAWANSLIWIGDNINAIYWPHKYTGIPVKLILIQIYGNIFFGGLIMLLIPYLVSTTMKEGLARFLIVGFVSAFTSVVVFYFWGMTSGMKDLVLSKLHVKKITHG